MSDSVPDDEREPGEPSNDPAEIRHWSQEMRVLRKKISAEDHAVFIAALEEQKRVGKELMRREMGLQ